MSKLLDFLKEHSVEISIEPNRDYTSMPKMIAYSKELETELVNERSRVMRFSVEIAELEKKLEEVEKKTGFISTIAYSQCRNCGRKSDG